MIISPPPSRASRKIQILFEKETKKKEEEENTKKKLDSGLI